MKKVNAPLIGANGNIFNLVSIASKSLKDNEQHESATEMTSRVFNSNSYEEALSIIDEYVEIVSEEVEYGDLCE